MHELKNYNILRKKKNPDLHLVHNNVEVLFSLQNYIKEIKNPFQRKHILIYFFYKNYVDIFPYNEMRHEFFFLFCIKINIF
jgi:hypothetical protein